MRLRLGDVNGFILSTFRTNPPLRDGSKGALPGHYARASGAGAPARTARAPGDGSSRSFVHQAWTVADGLPVNHVNQLYQTPDGYLWMATFDGLVRFNGVRFTVYNAANTPGLPSNLLVTIQPGHGASFWLTTEQDHLIRFEQRRIRSYDSEQTFHRAQVMLDGDSLVWVATRNGALHEVDGECILRTFDGRKLARPTHLEVRSGDLWFAVHDAIRRISSGVEILFQVPDFGAEGVGRCTRENTPEPKGIVGAMDGDDITGCCREWADKPAGWECPLPSCHSRSSPICWSTAGRRVRAVRISSLQALFLIALLSAVPLGAQETSTSIPIAVDRVQHARVSVFDILGREVALLFHGKVEPGREHLLRFQPASQLASGIYLLRVETDQRTSTQIVTLQR